MTGETGMEGVDGSNGKEQYGLRTDDLLWPVD